MTEYKGTRRLVLSYQDQAEGAYPISEQGYLCSLEETQSYYFD